MFRIMKNQIGSVLKQALATFNSTKPETFQANLETLRSELKKVTRADVDLNPDLLQERLWQKPNKAPVTYIHIYEDKQLTMGIFVLKPGMKLPLHNHPHMHGLIKVISGKVRITSYSINTQRTKEVEETLFASEESIPHRKFITAERCPDVTVDERSDSVLLNPNEKNLHEIETISGPAAFIDILSPPYDTVIEGNGVRHCSYYEVKQEIRPGVFRLQEVRSPSWYWTDSYRYPRLETFN